MTLVLATKTAGKIKFCTDSRLTFGTNLYADVGVKLFTIPIKVSSGGKIQYENTWGMAIAGSTTSSYILKEITQQILSDIELTKQPADFAKNICEYVLHIHKKLSDQLLPILRENGKSFFLLAGFCPNQEKVRTFGFEYDDTAVPPMPTFDELNIQDNTIIMFGSGKAAAQAHNNWTSWSIIKVMEKVITDGIEPSVGGKIQYGEFNESQAFELTQLLDMHKDGDTWKTNLTLNVFEYYKDNFGIQIFSPNLKTIASHPENVDKYVADQGKD